MSGLLTQVVRRQALNVVARRNTSGLIVHGPPVVKLTTAVNLNNSIQMRSIDHIDLLFVI